MRRAVIILLATVALLVVGGSAQQARWVVGKPAAAAPVLPPPPVFTGPYPLRVQVTGPPDTKIVLQRGEVAVPLDLATLGHLDVTTTLDAPLSEVEVSVTGSSDLGATPETGPLRCELIADGVPIATDTATGDRHTVRCATGTGV